MPAAVLRNSCGLPRGSADRIQVECLSVFYAAGLKIGVLGEDLFLESGMPLAPCGFAVGEGLLEALEPRRIV